MGRSGGATLYRGIHRVAGTTKGSYRSPGNIFNVDIEYLWVVAVALHLNRGINRVAETPRGSYRSQGYIFNVGIEYIWVEAVELHLIEASIEVQLHQEVATDLQVHI